MNRYLPAILNIFSAIAVFLVSFLVDLRIPMSKGMAKVLGLIIVYAGMALVAWAAFYIKEAMAGVVEPRLEVLVKDGPYRFVRHPVYVGTAIALAGVTVVLRSWLGLLSVALLFLPTELHRAKLEEQALARKFGTEWEAYARQTNFFLPTFGPPR
jgi:protein-S-isoprenylcysteine O-methyltransferase Ste14